MQRSRQMRDGQLQRIGAIVEGSSVCRRKATMITYSSIEGTVDLTSLGPVERSTAVSPLLSLRDSLLVDLLALGEGSRYRLYG